MLQFRKGKFYRAVSASGCRINDIKPLHGYIQIDRTSVRITRKTGSVKYVSSSLDIFPEIPHNRYIKSEENGMGEKTFHKHVSWIMFLYSVLVVWAHSFNADLFAKGGSSRVWNGISGFQSVFSTEISTAAVPGFFMISAYLFFRNFTWDKLPGKWRSRFFSVAVPYVTWNLLYYIGYVTATGIPAVQRVIGKEPVPFNMDGIMAAVLHYRYAPIFWYLYQLIILILLSPIIYMFVKNRILGLVYLAALILAVYFHLDTQHPNTDALLYYSFAAWMALHGRGVMEAEYGKRRLFAGAVSAGLTVFCFVKAHIPGAGVLWTVSYRFLIPASIWLLFDGRYAGGVRPWMRQSMFLYAIHFVVVRLVNKCSAVLLGSVLGESAMAAASMAVYILLPAAAVAVSYGAALFLGRFAPLVWKLLSGGRSLGEREGN